MSSRTNRMRSMPSTPLSAGSSVSQFSNLGSRDWFDVGFASERHHNIDVANEFGVDGLGCLFADVDSDFGERVGGEFVDPSPGLVPAECTSTESPAIFRISPAAICDLPQFLTQTNSTDGVAE